MRRLPELEAMAIFAKVVETRGISSAATDLGLSAPTVSKALTRLEQRLGSRLLNRTSRRFTLTDAGQMLAEKAMRLLADAEAAQDTLLAQSTSPRGLVRLAAPMSFGIQEVAPILPAFLIQYPEVQIDLSLDDARVDVIGDGFDVALRIGQLGDSSLLARKLAPVTGMLVAAPAYLDRMGRPDHPADLVRHDCFTYVYTRTRDIMHLFHKGEPDVLVRIRGRLRVNNGDAVLPAAIAGLGIAWLPSFFVREALRDGRLECILKGWSTAPSSLYLLTPQNGPRPARTEALIGFLTQMLSRPSDSSVF